MNAPRAACLTVCVYGLLIWLYVVLRLLLFRISIFERFIWDIPVSFWQLAIVSFIASAIGFYGYFRLNDVN